MAKSRTRATAVGRPPTTVSEWGHRFAYTPPPAIVKGAAPEETKWTPLLPSKTRQQKRATRRANKRTRK